MKRRRVKLGLYGLSMAEVTPYCQTVVERMTGNASFPTPNPPLADVTAAIDAFYTAFLAAEDGGKTLKATMRLRLETLYNKLRPLRDYVNQEANGDEEVLNSSGFPLAALPTPVGNLSIPGNLRVKTLSGKGKVEVVCDRVNGATGYQIRYRPVISEKPIPSPPIPTEGSEVTIEGAWEYKDPMGPTRQEVTGLGSAIYYEFQMRAIGSGNPSPWSGSIQGLPA